MNEILTKIALHYDNHRSCGLEPCPMVITEYESYQLFRHFRPITHKYSYPSVGAKIQCQGVTLIVVPDESDEPDEAMTPWEKIDD